MKRSTCLATIALAIAPVSAIAQQPQSKDVFVTNSEAHPVPVVAAPAHIVEYHLIGVTSAATTGSINFGGVRGRAAADLMCEAEFGRGARMALDEDRIHPDAIPLPTSWINSKEVRILNLGNDSFFAYRNNVFYFSDNAIDAAASLTCNGWRTGPRGLVMSSGFMAIDACTTEHPVACSVPMAIAVRQ